MNEIMFTDCETHGFYNEICLFQYIGLDDKEATVIEYPSQEWVHSFIKEHHTVWYNASYDLGTARVDFTNYTFDDLFYAARSAYPELERYSLDILHDHLGMSYYDKNLDKGKMQKSFSTAAAKRDRKATPEQIAYAKADVLTLRDLYNDKKVQKILRTNKAYALDIETLKYTLVIQRNGIPVDREALHKEQEALVERIASNTIALNGLNPNSPKQCCEALGVNKTDKETLVKLMSEGNTLAGIIFDQRRALKARGMLESWDYPRIYTFFNPAGTITGRFSASGGDDIPGYVNTQQITRKYQYMFHNPDPAKTTFEIDYGTAELRAGCSIMGDEAMYQELMEGKDLHIEAARLTGIANPTKEDRQKGKAVSFGLIFSMSANSFKDYAFTNYGVTFSQRQSERIHANYHKKYKQISQYHNWCWNNYKTVAVESAMGRRNVCRLGTDASNFSTQASIAEATKWAVVFLVREHHKALKHIINIVHDCVIMEVSTKQFDRWASRLEHAMLKGWYEVCKSDLFKFKDIPMPVDVQLIKGL